MSDILRQFAEDPLPPSAVDVRCAVRVGRRRRRAQAGFVAAGMVAVLATGASTAPQWLRYLPGRGVTPGGPISCDGGGPLPSAAPADPEYLDVLRRWVDVSGVAGYRVVEYDTTRMYQLVRLVNAADDREVDITVYAAQGRPAYRIGEVHPTVFDPATGDPTDPIGGQPAYLLPAGDELFGPATGVAWQWASGAWVLVSVVDTAHRDTSAAAAATPTGLSDVELAGLRSTAAEVARGLRVGPGEQIRSPLHLPVPDCTRLQSTALLYGTKADGTPWTRFALGFGPDGPEAYNPLLFPGDAPHGISVTAASGETPADKPGAVNAELDGHPTVNQGGFIVVHGVDGFALEISTPGGYDAGAAIYRSITIYPGAAQTESAWGPPSSQRGGS